MAQPTSDEIREAKAYLRRRLAAEVSMEHFLNRVLHNAAVELVSLAYRYNIPPTMFSFSYDPLLSLEAERIISKLMQDIEDFDFMMALSTDKSDRDTLIPYINREINGLTYKDRLWSYTSRFKLEMQDLIGAGLVLGYGLSKMKEEVVKSLKNPYVSTIASEKPHRGQSSYHRLLVLTRHTIADTWMYADMEQAIRKGAIGFYSFRGSSYPCQLCDDMASRFHTFAEPYPPYHPSCMCYAVPVYR